MSVALATAPVDHPATSRASMVHAPDGHPPASHPPADHATTDRPRRVTTSGAPVRRRRPVYLRPVAAGTGLVESAEVMSPAPLVAIPAIASKPARAKRPRDVFDDDVTPLRSLHGPAADPARVCASILQVAAEAMRGVRPLVQLTRWVDAAIFAELAEFAPPHGSRTSVRQRLAPDSAASVLARGQFRKVRVARVSAHVAECTVLVHLEGRVRAVVVRLEEHGTAWRATALGAL